MIRCSGWGNSTPSFTGVRPRKHMKRQLYHATKQAGDVGRMSPAEKKQIMAKVEMMESGGGIPALYTIGHS